MDMVSSVSVAEEGGVQDVVVVANGPTCVRTAARPASNAFRAARRSPCPTTNKKVVGASRIRAVPRPPVTAQLLVEERHLRMAARSTECVVPIGTNGVDRLPRDS